MLNIFHKKKQPIWLNLLSFPCAKMVEKSESNLSRNINSVSAGKLRSKFHHRFAKENALEFATKFHVSFLKKQHFYFWTVCFPIFSTVLHRPM